MIDQSDDFPILSPACFKLFRKIALSHAGIVIPDKKEDMVYGRLLPRLRQLHLKSFDEYAKLIECNAFEESKFINLMTNPTTGFFRERHHFKMLSRYLSHELMNNSRIRIWSAGCATGEEAYSIGIIVNEVYHDKRGKDIKILATDIDSDCLNVAKTGIYEIDKVTALKQKELKCFYRGVGDQAGLVKVKEPIRDLVFFRRLNLIEKWPMTGLFDVIFCRNVTIYFDKKVTQNVLYHMDRLLKPNGLLILGHSEQLYDLESNYKLVGKSVCRKLPQGGVTHAKD